MDETISTIILLTLAKYLGIAIAIIILIIKIIFFIRVWKIVQYHYNKIKYEEEIIKEKIKEEKEESKTMKKINNFLFREDE